MKFAEEINSRIQKLSEKYNASGQDLLSFLDGLLYADYITYWDYIHLDTLLSLQTPRTPIPDEEVFIMYHQITELYFKLSLHELKQISKREKMDAAFLKEKIRRINRYFRALTDSFGVMEDGMDRDQFLHFRMALIPASGFQSVQYRLIEVMSTDFINLVSRDHRDKYDDNSRIEEMYQDIYWKNGATIEDTGAKTLTLSQFEQKYTDKILRWANRFQKTNLWQRYLELPTVERENEELVAALKTLDLQVNVFWPLQHYKTAVRYLAKRPHDIAATGGTNWQKYLPPRFQRRIFYPELWTEKEKSEWGKSWVENVLAELNQVKK
ncbi:MAG: tryptophan 2,3-dioxygenase family protein [Bacteroidota bacterium]|nr:tryptophan 2,3-dioxygenase family protein [Bacteroidota bacterium]MDX5447200.1 tryptophan 2,3-dioxygenase family protein [Bacteroidota bacterium]MDX5505885.1 tryptophan 2,3-dioxygenase family protein [Bacteroidota bacterium]